MHTGILSRRFAVRGVQGALALVVVITLALAVSCNGDDAEEVLNPTQIRWTVSDECSDGLGIQVRFFDTTGNLVWPADDLVYRADPGDSVSQLLDCEKDHQICYGAETYPGSGTYWGVGINGTSGCDDCCTECSGNLTRSVNLTCASAASAP